MNAKVSVSDVYFMTGPGPLKARADILIEFPEGSSIVLFGLSVIEKNGKPPWVALPSKKGNIPGKYFPVVDAQGEIRKQIADVVLEAYRTAKAV
jgi:DNA-binding cell septation regulator SpoVG